MYHIRYLIAAECPSWLGIPRLVQAGGINAYTLHTGFKQLFHRTPYEYFLDQRFVLVKEWLRSNESVINIAYQLGYRPASAFIEQFKARFGCTPKAFQQHN